MSWEAGRPPMGTQWSNKISITPFDICRGLYTAITAAFLCFRSKNKEVLDVEFMPHQTAFSYRRSALKYPIRKSTMAPKQGSFLLNILKRKMFNSLKEMFKEEEVVEFSVILALSPNSRSGPALPQYHRQLNPCEIGQS